MSHQPPKYQTLVQKAHADAYSALIARLADQHPGGGVTVYDLGHVNDEMTSATLLAHPEVLDEVSLSVDLLAILYAQRRIAPGREQLSHCEAQRCRGAHLDAEIQFAVIRQLLHDLWREQERRDELAACAALDERLSHGDQRSEREIALSDAGVPHELRS